MAMMVLPVLVGEFGFESSEEFFIWFALCAAMLLAYFICWGVYFRRPFLGTALWLAILPSAIFILRDVFLRHWLLSVFGVIFAFGHIYNHMVLQQAGGKGEMSKYAPLWAAVSLHDENKFWMSFVEVEQILRFPIDHAFLNYKKELLEYGWQVGKISLKAQTVLFQRRCD